MRRIKDVLVALIVPRARLLALRWHAASRICGSREHTVRASCPILVPCLFLALLAACDDAIEWNPYNYDTRESAKLKLPKGSAVELEGKHFILKKKIKLPLGGK